MASASSPGADIPTSRAIRGAAAAGNAVRGHPGRPGRRNSDVPAGPHVDGVLGAGGPRRGAIFRSLAHPLARRCRCGPVFSPGEPPERPGPGPRGDVPMCVPMASGIGTSEHRNMRTGGTAPRRTGARHPAALVYEQPPRPGRSRARPAGPLTRARGPLNRARGARSPGPAGRSSGPGAPAQAGTCEPACPVSGSRLLNRAPASRPRSGTAGVLGTPELAAQQGTGEPAELSEADGPEPHRDVASSGR